MCKIKRPEVKTKTLQTLISETTYKRAKAYCKKEKCSMSLLLNASLNNWLDAYEKIL